MEECHVLTNVLLSFPYRCAILSCCFIIALSNLESFHKRKYSPTQFSLLLLLLFPGIRDLLLNPNPEDPAQSLALNTFKNDIEQYNRQIREQAKKFQPSM